jgi:hypothetical protein
MTTKVPRKRRRGTPRDMTVANWKRTLARLRRNIEELRSYDCEIREPDNFDTPPERRTSVSSPGVQ